MSITLAQNVPTTTFFSYLSTLYYKNIILTLYIFCKINQKEGSSKI